MDSKEQKLSFSSKILLVITALLLVISIFVPLWRIDLDAPQYPEGLNLMIYADHLGGNVDIINGLNHYIGMKTLHKEDFVEFTVLPYVIAGFAILSLLVLTLNRRRWLNLLFGAFVLFGILAMYDFWRWEYDYGHNLDPNAAIIVPGMAYQPPLIGFKQLLNFGAYSIPDIGGWCFIVSGLLLLLAFLKEYNFFRKLKSAGIATLSTIAISMFTLLSCGAQGPEPIRFNKDNCAHCKMTITDPKFGAELITTKGRVYKFDDLNCMLNYKKENKAAEKAQLFFTDFETPHALTPVQQLHFIEGAKLKSPMAGNTAGFSNKESADRVATQLSAKKISWEVILSR